MLKNRRTPRIALGALLAAAGLAGRAAAQDCTVSLSDPNCYHLKGSDTLFDIMKTAINKAQTDNIAGAKNLYYDGTGSGNAENQMKNNSGTGTPVPGAALPLGVQSIGPMSRNLRPGVIDSASAGFAAADGSNNTAKQGHASWAPTCQNVLGLDAAVFITRGTGKGSALKNVNFPTAVDNAISTDPTTRAVTNNTALPTSFSDSSAFNNTSATVNYSNLLMVILGGVDGSGTLAACSDPRRVRAVQDLAAAMGVGTIDHLYRRDDNSGTTDTWKDRIITQNVGTDPRYPILGGRFCNGQSIGGINGAATQTGICSVTRTNITCRQDSDCPAGEVCQFNLNNQDLDPIRRPCVAADATHAPTSCTDMTTGKPCQAGDGNANCTQGLIVALTDADPGSDSVTNSIGARIKNDSAGKSVGYAGKEAVLPGKGTKGLTINTTGFTDVNVRKGAYLLSRRLFLQNALVSGQPVGDQPSDTAGPNISITGQGANQLTAEQNLFLYMTDPSGSLTAGVPGRAITDPILKQYNFITCDTKSTGVCSLSNNLCSKSPAAPVAGAAGAFIPNGALGGSDGSGGTKSIDSQGRVWSGTALVQASCTGTALCASGTCSGNLCPLATGRLSNAACSQNSDCQSGVCQDTLSFGAAPAYLLCQ
jgi:hypothetical protein